MRGDLYELGLRRYRYTGKERDEETGLYYYGTRYYIPWLARWTAADAIGIEDGLNLYLFVQNNPIVFVDPNGQAKTQPQITQNFEMESEYVTGDVAHANECALAALGNGNKKTQEEVNQMVEKKVVEGRDKRALQHSVEAGKAFAIGATGAVADLGLASLGLMEAPKLIGELTIVNNAFKKHWK